MVNKLFIYPVHLLFLLGFTFVSVAYANQIDGDSANSQAKLAAEPKNSLTSIHQHKLSLDALIKKAVQQDLWLKSNQLSEQAANAQSIAVDNWADPNFSLALANVPIDSLSLNQEGMTQVKFGVSQMLPRGDSQHIQQQQWQNVVAQHPIQRQLRQLQLTQQISLLWLEYKLAQQIEQRINQDQVLFEQMVELAKARYASAIGQTRQQDIIRAELELSQLHEKRLLQQQKQQNIQAQLAQWLPDIFSYQLNTTVAEIVLNQPDISTNWRFQQMLVIKKLMQHPQVQLLDNQFKSRALDVQLSEQAYKPQWMVNASYAYRADGAQMDRSDFVSVGVSFDWPIFASNKQDQNNKAAIAKAEAVKTDKQFLLQTMYGQALAAAESYLLLQQRHQLYQDTLLDQSKQQAQAAITAYTNDDGDFAEVVRARIGELNTHIQSLQLHTQKLQQIVQLNYFFPVLSIQEAN
ncbi:TolC family protein [Catenovulum sp. SX2]|uniref:TolC family protein n=1 Tax=Catenovulum sp. SX2 TaxID=3398614 RepID=UPI003F86746D